MLPQSYVWFPKEAAQWLKITLPGYISGYSELTETVYCHRGVIPSQQEFIAHPPQESKHLHVAEVFRPN
ncbi:MAG TPA: hypothetical protein DEF45_16660 [Rhodopirellula sp.]|nr:MAG: hypothetical protein CBD74_03260 [Saprospirales bacterium TMED214]HBV64643.1 hypothetical protein [Rhodopirellula sp.]